MILPIYTYGHAVLRKKAEPLLEDNMDAVQGLIADMWDTMYQAAGIGLAAPQVGKSLRLFIVDTTQLQEEGAKKTGIKKVFVNPEIIKEWGDSWLYEEGCLSIPKLTGDVERKPQVRIRYLDNNFVAHTEDFDGINARVIQHEYDHVEGILFVDRLKPVKRRLLSRKLDAMRKGKLKADYKIKLPV